MFGNLLERWTQLADRVLPVPTRRHRRVSTCNSRAHIEVRGARRVDTERFVRAVEEALEKLEAVRWAEVNAVLGRVVVAFDDEQIGVDDLVEVIEGVEEAHEMSAERFSYDHPEHPADIEPLRRNIFALGADVTGFGVSVFGRVLRATPIPLEVASVVAMVDAVPRLRHELESRVGAPVADLGLALANAVAQALGQGPLGLVVDVAHRSLLVREIQGRRQVWQAREPELHSRREDESPRPIVVEERPEPLPGGPIETYSDRAALGSLGAAGALLLATRDVRRAGDALLVGMPKAARLGREAFASQLGCVLAERGVVVMDPAVLRRLDRVDAVVLDAASLRTGGMQLGDIDPLADALVAASRGAGHLVVVAGDEPGIARLGADRVVAGAERVVESVRRLQAEGRVVALVSDRERAGLHAADCGIGVLGGPASPWGADLLCGPGLTEACFVVEATAAARVVSERSAAFALYGSAAGALLAIAGPRLGAARRAVLGVNGSALAAVAAGAWSAVTLARRPSPVAVETTPWHDLPTEDVLGLLETSASGLAAEDVERRRAERGDVVDDGEPAGLGRASLDELANPLTPVLATGAGMSAASGGLTDAALIGGVMGVNAVIGGAQRVGADRALRRLVDASAVKVHVRRDGEEVLTTADRLVRGDVVVFEAGDVVPVDCRVLEAHALEVDESSLTGESQLVEKQVEPLQASAIADRRSMLYEGTTVAAGRAVAVVVATGLTTEVGRTSATARGEPRSGGVEARLRSLTAVTVPVALGAGAALMFSGLLRGRPLRETLAAGVGLTVAAVPEGLPLVATVAQLGAARRLSGRNALVRHSRTIEALGRVDVLCFDKTGTLTEGRIVLRRVSDGVVDEEVDALGMPRRLVLAAALRATPLANGDGSLAHPTDEAVVSGGAVANVLPELGVGTWELIDEVPFEPARGYHAVLGRSEAGPVLSVKGAPEVVLSRCVAARREDGPHPLDAATRAAIDAGVDRLARRGFRVLVVAERAASGRADLDDARVARLELLGLVALADPVRSTASAAVSGLRRAGVDVVMLTGDHPSTAEAIAAELDLLDGRVVTGPEVDGLDDTALAGLLSESSVFARVSPAHKVRIVEALRRAGRVVAVTGDGANDAPAIHLADVGIALGLRGTNAAKEAADVVVTDDRIETIVDAIVEGRAMWASVRDAIGVLLGGNLGEIGFTLGAGVVSGRSPLNARQLLLVNLLTDMLPSMALALVPPRRTTPEALLREGPEASLGSALTRDVVVRAVATAGAAGGAWVAARATGTRGRAGSVALVALVGAQLGQTVVVGRANPLVLGATIVSGAALGAIVQTPGVSHFFGCRPLGPVGWVTGVTAAAVGTGLAAAAPWALSRVLDGGGQPGSAAATGPPRRALHVVGG